jgi:hypothetical protein
MLSITVILVVYAVNAWAGFASKRVRLAWSVALALAVLVALMAAMSFEIPHGAVTPVEVGAIAFAVCFGGSALGLLSGRFVRKLRNTSSNSTGSTNR